MNTPHAHKQACRVCGRMLDAQAEQRGLPVAPKVGDWSVCLYCGAVSQFGGDGILKRPWERVPEEVGRVIQVIAEAKGVSA